MAATVTASRMKYMSKALSIVSDYRPYLSFQTSRYFQFAGNPISFIDNNCPPSPSKERKFRFKSLPGLIISEKYLMQLNTANSLFERISFIVSLSINKRISCVIGQFNAYNIPSIPNAAMMSTAVPKNSNSM